MVYVWRCTYALQHRCNAYVPGKIIDAADAYVVVTAEYNNCLPPPLTNLLDHFSPSTKQ